MRNNIFLSNFLTWLLLCVVIGCSKDSGVDPPTKAETDDPVSENADPQSEDPASETNPGSEGTSPEAGTQSSSNGSQEEPPESTPDPEQTTEDPQPEQGSHGEGAKKDFVKLNGAIFKDWPKPQAAILISGEQLGYLEPCGCAGLENQKGGLKRRHTLVRSLVDRGWPVAPIDLGGQIRRYGPQAEIKFSTAIDSLVKIGYQVVGLGPQDLSQPAEQLISVAANLAGDKNPLVAANVGLFELPSEFVAPMRVIEMGGRRIGITSILGDEFQARVNNDDIKFAEAAEALKKIVPEMREKADFLVLLSHATKQESEKLATRFPEFNVVVNAGSTDHPPKEPTKLNDGKTLLIEVGLKGMYVVVLGLYDQEPTVRFQLVPLDGRFADSPEMTENMNRYQRQLETLGLAGLGVRQHEHPSGRKFVGSQACANCHSEATEVFENTPHSHATQTLVDLDPTRHFDPECLSCHVTGWHPQKFFPYISGYTGLEATPEMRGNGCENCHGPGSQHVAAESGDIEADEKQLEEFRNQMRLKLVEGELEEKEGVVGAVFKKCVECHDIDNSPDFHKKGAFKRYWDQVKHVGKD